jgi:hypothetical protein
MANPLEAGEDWEIEGRVRLETADYLHAWFYAPEFRTSWQYLVFLPFSFLLIVVGSPVPPRQWLSYAPWMLASLPIGVLAAWAYRNHWASTSFARVGPQQIVYCFDSEGLRVSSSVGKYHLAWDELLNSIETPRAFLVFFQRSQFLLVPKRSFTATEVVEVTELLATMPRRAGGRRVLRTVGVWLLVCVLVLVLFELFQSH